MIEEELHQIEQEVAEEKLMLGNSPSLSNHKAFQELVHKYNRTHILTIMSRETQGTAHH
jgi:hypothetical protein